MDALVSASRGRSLLLSGNSAAMNSQTILSFRAIVGCAVLLLGSGASATAADLLSPSEPLLLKGTKGGFDFITVDAARRRLLAAHTGNNSLDVIDLDQSQLIKSVPTGAAQDCVVSSKGDAYLVSVSKPPQLAIVDPEKLSLTGTVALNGPADLLAVSPTGNAYVAHDDGKDLWVINAAEKKVVATIELPSEAPEDLVFSADGKHLFQAMKTASKIEVIDSHTNKIVHSWPTAPAAGPHGIAAVPAFGTLLIAGGNGKLALMSQMDGKVLATADIPERVDQIAYDAEKGRVYCASSTGKLAIYNVEKNKLTKAGEVQTSQGAKSVALDPKTHAVWVAYAKGDSSYVQKFSPASE